jgi:6-phosphofructokinase
MKRTDKMKLLDSIFNQGNINSLKSLSRPIYPKVLIYETQGGGLLLSGRLNPTIPARYQDKIMNEKELDTMLFAGGNGTTFLLPDNGRN